MRIERFHDEALSNEVLKAIEQSWELKLPSVYRSFLLKYNAGLIDDLVFDFKDKSDGSCLTSLFGIVRDYNNNLLLKQKYAGDRIPSNMLPIGRDVYVDKWDRVNTLAFRRRGVRSGKGRNGGCHKFCVSCER